MKRESKLRWSIISLRSTNQTSPQIFEINKKKLRHDVGNPGPGFEWTHKCGKVIWVNGIHQMY